ncbi:asparagine synthase (glutamine-hydrolysing) [Amycolatopsis arida]|uniref:Asparagine synthase (Glutamine-hydrolysing) n=1 Tax=Amycolatopsis arida TaxID=587909 RepID=A0A1I5YX35_9PSEU|nr:lasso peptide isopeptide bond-forming cyclase [Amycolatopsis arida]TDX89953.1 asparagine synthase (glutamine-hydrolysing) [Amycolatopsis arida]SFQ48796.1 asparagine synthase (glutamine-hydrolysing) [Amycolatopsis arida]
MSESPNGPGHGEAYFVVLPDHESAVAVASRLLSNGWPNRGANDAGANDAGANGVRTLSHPSGRPWIVGRWRDADVVAAGAGGTSLAVIGCCPVDAAELTAAAARLRDLAQLDALALRLPGSFHLVAARDGRCRVQGPASGLRLVFSAAVGGTTVAADRADVLAGLTGARLDIDRLATRLLFPVPHPLADQPLWHGVHGVPPGSALVLERDGRSREIRWWQPPEPVRRLPDAAPGARRALAEAVDARTRAGGVVGCDLSGGLDSTSVCFLAARGPAKVVASTWPGIDPADDDLTWARRAAAHLPEVEHAVWPAERSPLVYADLLEIDDPLDEPTIGVLDLARLLSDLEPLAARGCRVRLTGIGGDHVAWCSEAHYHTLLRTRPWQALPRLRGFRALFHWPWSTMVRALADTRPYPRWLAGTAGELRAPLPPTVTAALGWGAPPRLFDWVTPDAEHAARAALRAASRNAVPLGSTRGQHVDLEQVRASTRIIRQWEQISARAGLPISSPYFDDRVIEAFLSVRPLDRVTPWRYKPVLVAAMRGVVPDDCLTRTSKAQAALDAAAGLRAHRGDLAELWAESRLAELGLVDRDRLIELALRPATPELTTAILYSTIGCEVWLRTLEAHQAPVTALSRTEHR